MMFNCDMYSQFIIQKKAIQVQTSSLNLHILIACLKLQSWLRTWQPFVWHSLPEKVNKSDLPNQILRKTSPTTGETGSKLLNISQTLQGNRFAPPLEIENYIKENEKWNSTRKTISHQRLLESYLVVEYENRQIHENPANELNLYLCQFIVSVRQKNGDEYEPVTLRSMISSFERYLKRHNYGISFVNGNEFGKLPEVLI
jgi:hypothetical protein